jgi:hypothetical protein
LQETGQTADTVIEQTAGNPAVDAVKPEVVEAQATIE